MNPYRKPTLVGWSSRPRQSGESGSRNSATKTRRKLCKMPSPHLFVSNQYILKKSMYYMYLIRSKKNQSFYIGSTRDLKARLLNHNNGESIYTKQYLPWKLVYYESYLDYKLAFRREKSLKKRAKVGKNC